MEQPFKDDGGRSDAHVVAVLPDEHAAGLVRERLVAMGVADDDIRIDVPADDVASLRAEMRREVEDAYISPQVGIAWPKEGLKSVVALGFGLSVAATLACLPLAWLLADEWTTGGKVLAAAVVGVFVGGTIAIIAGAAGTRGPAEPLAAELGVTVRVASADPAIVRTIESCRPLRVDLVLPDGTPTGVTPDEEPDHAVRTAADRLAHQHDPSWADAEAQHAARAEGRAPKE